MRILVIGAYWDAQGHISCSTARALKVLGHDVSTFDYVGFRDRWSDKLRNRLNARLHARGWKVLGCRVRELLERVRDWKPELVLALRAETISPDTWRCIKKTSVLANWCQDDPFQWGAQIPEPRVFDYFFVFDPFYIPLLRDAGARNVDFLPCAADADVYRPLSLSSAEREVLGSDLCFVGTWYQCRQVILESLLEFNLAIWGSSWKLPLMRPWNPLRRAYRGRACGHEVVKIYNAARIVLNIHHPQSRSAMNMRTYEACAAGAFQLVDDKAELRSQFAVGEDIVAYRDVQDLKRLARYYLAHPDEARHIAQSGRRRVLAEHTYVHRMKAMFAAMRDGIR